jgi:hypothetical protein
LTDGFVIALRAFRALERVEEIDRSLRRRRRLKDRSLVVAKDFKPARY